MNLQKILFIFGLCLFSSATAQTWKTEDQYIQKFAPYAVEEMEKYQIPASITLAQGLLETGGGQSRLAQQGNNHFGIKCKEEWTGKTMSHTDDAPNECFRVYDDPRESYEDHSKFLRFRKYYQDLFTLDLMDYKAWAHGLKRAGYATNPRYAYILIDKIEKHKLYEFDRSNSKETYFTLLKLYPELKNDRVFMAKVDQSSVQSEPVTLKVPYKQTSYAKTIETVQKMRSDAELLQDILIKTHPNSQKKFIIIPAQTDVAFISRKFNISENQIVKWNELSSSVLQKNDVLFLESKASKAVVSTYKVQPGDTMHDVAQKFGIKLSQLYSKNRMSRGDEPQVGQVLYLQKRKPRH